MNEPKPKIKGQRSDRGTGAVEELGIKVERNRECRLSFGHLGKGMVSFFSNGTPIVAIEDSNIEKLKEATGDEIQKIQMRGRINLLSVLKPMSEPGETFAIDYGAYKRVQLYSVYHGFEPTLKQQRAANVLGVKQPVVHTMIRSDVFETFPYPSTGARVIFLSSFLRVVPEEYHEEAISLARLLRKEMGLQEINRIKKEIGWKELREWHPIEEQLEEDLRRSSIADVAQVRVEEQTINPRPTNIHERPRVRLAEARERTWQHGSWAMMDARVSDLEVIDKRLKAHEEDKIFMLNGEPVNRIIIKRYLVLVVSSGALLSEIATGRNGMPTMLEIHRWRQDDVNFAAALDDAEGVQAQVFADTALASVMDGSRETANLNRYQHDALLLRAGMQAERFREKRFAQIETVESKSKEELMQDALRILKSKPELLNTMKSAVSTLEEKKDEPVAAPDPEETFYPDPE